MTANTLSLEMPGVDFKSMAREAIAAKLTEALVGADDAIIKIVAAAMERRVDSRGQTSTYASDNKIPYVEWLAQDLIQQATKQALAAKVEELRPAIEKQIEKQLSKNVKSIAASLTETFIRTSKAGHGVIINMTATLRTND